MRPKSWVEHKTTPKWRLEKSGGEMRLYIEDAGFEAPQILNLSRWHPLGQFTEKFARWFALDKKGMRRNSRYSAVSNINNGWIAFIHDHRVKIEKPSDLTTPLVAQFIDYLKTKQSNGAALSIQSQMHYWSTLKGVLRQGLPEINVGKVVLNLPFAPFSNEYRAPPKAEETDLEAWATIIRESAKSVRQTLHGVGQVRQEVERGLSKRRITKLSRQMVERAALTEAAIYFIQRYDGLLPERRWLKEQSPEDFEYVERVGYTALCRLMHPQQGDLVPFVYLLAAHTGFNQAPLLSLRLEDYQYADVMGVEKLVLSASKLRANSKVRRSFRVTDKELDVPTLLRFLEAWTRHLRQHAPNSMKEDLFLYANKWKSGKQPYKTLATHDVRSSRELTNSMLRFCRERNITYLGLRAFRANFAERYRQLRPQDAEGLRVLLGQQRIKTTEDHYRSDRRKAESQEALGGAMLAHERMISAGGKVDLRRVPAHRERTAATPGFGCLDPLDSPLSSETKGQLCRAYGRCPECHLAVSSADSSYALARFLQLKEAYDKAKRQLGEIAFAHKYAASERALKSKWLSLKYTRKEIERAATLLLGELPDLE